jgi:hypothetical protein
VAGVRGPDDDGAAGIKVDADARRGTVVLVVAQHEPVRTVGGGHHGTREGGSACASCRDFQAVPLPQTACNRSGVCHELTSVAWSPGAVMR